MKRDFYKPIYINSIERYIERYIEQYSVNKYRTAALEKNSLHFARDAKGGDEYRKTPGYHSNIFRPSTVLKMLFRRKSFFFHQSF